MQTCIISFANRTDCLFLVFLKHKALGGNSAMEEDLLYSTVYYTTIFPLIPNGGGATNQFHVRNDRQLCMRDDCCTFSFNAFQQ